VGTERNPNRQRISTILTSETGLVTTDLVLFAVGALPTGGASPSERTNGGHGRLGHWIRHSLVRQLS